MAGLISGAAVQPRATEPAFPVHISVKADQGSGPLEPIWRFFGADEPNYTTMRDGSRLLGELGALDRGNVFFRTHNLLNTGDGTPALKWGSTGVYREDDEGRPVYDWTILDRIFDTCLQRGVRPYVEIGFMPEALSTHPEPYQHSWRPGARYDEIYTGWAYPPTDYRKWEELVRQWAEHAVTRYGEDEVNRWFWEVWNEPNIPYWQGTQEEFFRLHDHAIRAVRRVLPTAQVGGPDVAGGPGGRFLEEFLNHCLHGTNYATGTIGTPVDFIAFHAKGSPRMEGGHVRMGIANQLRNINDAFAVIARFPEFKKTPIVIGESDPEGCAACQGPQLAYRNGTMYSSYTAASFARKHALTRRHGVNLIGALTWAFTFDDQPFFAGFRALASNGIGKPVLNVFRMMSRMKGEQLAVDSDGEVPLDEILRNGVRGRPDVSALASRDGNRLWVLLWHYHDDDLPGPAADITLEISGMSNALEGPMVRQFRVDGEHGNAYEVWKQMGSPAVPSLEQYAELEQAALLAEIPAPEMSELGGGRWSIEMTLPRQGVTLLEIGRWQAHR
ncbi:MAG: beta-xylosidase [Verrucomicrobiales bacterium]|nr:beta-xylosidase [Verrucomicrobiales bacterium]